LGVLGVLTVLLVLLVLTVLLSDDGENTTHSSLESCRWALHPDRLWCG
jgi:hypothetical protein